MSVQAHHPDVITRELPQIVTDCLNIPGSVASLPTVATELMRLADDPESKVDDIVRVINTDPALCARVLKVANSSFYGFSRTIASIKHAITLLGLNAVKNIAVAASLHKVFRSHQHLTALNPRDLWLHSFGVAIAAREISNVVGSIAADEAFLAGLMHDVGIIVEMQAFRSEFSSFEKLLLDCPKVTFRDAERQFFGATHEDFGAGLCQVWKFPRSIEEAIAGHHAPNLEVESDHATLAFVIHAAELFATNAGYGFSREVEVAEISDHLREHLKLSSADCNNIAHDLPETIKEALPVFALSTLGPPQLLVVTHGIFFRRRFAATCH